MKGFGAFETVSSFQHMDQLKGLERGLPLFSAVIHSVTSLQAFGRLFILLETLSKYGKNPSTQVSSVHYPICLVPVSVRVLDIKRG